MRQLKILNEDTKSDIAAEVTKQLKSSDLKTTIEKIVKDRIKNDPAFEDKFIEISRNVITQLFKTLWTKRAVWRNNLTNKSS